MKVMKLDAGRTMITENGLPALIEIHTREATTAPARLKAMFTVKASKVPLPLFVPTVAVPGHTAHGYAPEFRMEQN